MWEEAEGNSDSSVLVAAARAAEEPAVDCLPFAAGGLGGKHAWRAATPATPCPAPLTFPCLRLPCFLPYLT